MAIIQLSNFGGPDLDGGIEVRSVQILEHIKAVLVPMLGKWEM